MTCTLTPLDAVEDGDLRLCEARGIAWQADMTRLIDYGASYYGHYAALEGSDVAVRLNHGRVALLGRHVAEGASVLDIGAGSGAFVKAAISWGFGAKGYDINPATVAHLRAIGAYAEPGRFEAYTFWDSLEHMPHPGAVLRQIPQGAVAIVALPIVTDLRRIRESKHYKPGEHLWYFTADGFVRWMAEQGFHLLESSEHETRAGRESIGAFAFRKGTAPCPCGGETFVDDFDWPGRARQFFLRCQACRGMSDPAPTKDAAFGLAITPGQAAEAR